MKTLYLIFLATCSIALISFSMIADILVNKTTYLESSVNVTDLFLSIALRLALVYGISFTVFGFMQLS